MMSLSYSVSNKFTGLPRKRKRYVLTVIGALQMYIDADDDELWSLGQTGRDNNVVKRTA